MQSGALRKATRRPKLEKLHHGGNVVVDASERFAQRRNPQPAQAAPLLPVPVSGTQASTKAAAPRPPLTIKPLKSRVALDRRLAFILIQDGVDGTDGTRCVLFTVIPVPVDEADDERYLAPYLLRGWEVLLQCPSRRPGLPGVVDMHDDPQTVLQHCKDRMDKDNLITAKIRMRDNPRFVADPLSR